MTQANDIGDELAVDIEKAVKALTLEITANLIETTPVDTGWARANWVPNIGEAREGTNGTRAQAEAGSVNNSAQAAELAKVAARYKLAGGNVHITNNVDYIEKLNEGSSRQAPAGFVQIGIAKAVSDIVNATGGNRPLA